MSENYDSICSKEGHIFTVEFQQTYLKLWPNRIEEKYKNRKSNIQ